MQKLVNAYTRYNKEGRPIVPWARIAKEMWEIIRLSDVLARGVSPITPPSDDDTATDPENSRALKILSALKTNSKLLVIGRACKMGFGLLRPPLASTISCASGSILPMIATLVMRSSSVVGRLPEFEFRIMAPGPPQAIERQPTTSVQQDSLFLVAWEPGPFVLASATLQVTL
ncbi:hypothetical protein ACHAPJ_006056 [Fusarium lateritium]